jgi:hypothetical protein
MKPYLQRLILGAGSALIWRTTSPLPLVDAPLAEKGGINDRYRQSASIVTPHGAVPFVKGTEAAPLDWRQEARDPTTI